MLKELRRNEEDGYRVCALNISSVQGYKPVGKLSVTGNGAVIDIERMSGDAIKITAKLGEPIVLYFEDYAFFERPTVKNGVKHHWQAVPFQGQPGSCQTWSI